MTLQRKKTQKEMMNFLFDSCGFIDKELHDALQMKYSDGMRFQKALSIALKLRTLLNDEGRNNSLLKQLGLKQKLLFNLASINHPDLALNLVASYSLLKLVFNNNKSYCEPLFEIPNYNITGLFDLWWNEIVLDSKGIDAKHASRRDVVLTLSDKEGGAHFDDTYDPAFSRIQFGKGWHVMYNNEYRQLENNLYAESVFVIAQEFLDAISFYDSHINYKTHDFRSKYNMVCLDYPGNNPRTRNYRCAYNPGNKLNGVLRLCYDYYREAEYSLHRLFYRRYFNEKNQLLHQVLVVDVKNKMPLKYIIAEKERYVLLGDKENLYRVIEKDEDINAITKGIPLDDLVQRLIKR